MSSAWSISGNPHSAHVLGRSARQILKRAIETIAEVLSAHPDEVIVTSGGTESNNLALFGLFGLDCESGHALSTRIEHPAVIEPLAKLQTRGLKIKYANVSRQGIVDAKEMAGLATTETRFASMILAHNETGAIQPVQSLVHELSDRHIPVHTDAVQAVGRIPVDFHGLGVATLATSAHKFGGPCGVGVLLVRRGITLTPWFGGGGQQRGLRPGTLPIALVAGFACALDTWRRESESRIHLWVELRDALEAALIWELGAENVVRNGPVAAELRLPQTLNVAFPGRDRNALLLNLDQAGVCASLGSACASGSRQPSPSLVAMGLPKGHLEASVRFSLGWRTTRIEINEAVRRITRAVKASSESSETTTTL